jgi:hypothetical protein
MSRIYDLTQEQEKVLNDLYFLDSNDEEDQPEIERLNAELFTIRKSAEHTLEFLHPILLEIGGNISAEKGIIDDIKKGVLLRAERRLKKETNSFERLNAFMLQIINNFEIKSLKLRSGETLYKNLTPGSLVFDENFNANSLPKGFTETIPAVPAYEKPITAKITAALREAIKDNKDKLDQTTTVVELVEMPGVRLVRSESLKVK